MRNRNIKTLRAEVDAFNALHPPGSKIIVQTRTKGEVQTTVRSPAEILIGRIAVAWFQDLPGCYLISQTRAVPNGGPDAAA